VIGHPDRTASREGKGGGQPDVQLLGSRSTARNAAYCCDRDDDDPAAK